MKLSISIVLKIIFFLVCWQVMYAQDDILSWNQWQRENLLLRFEELVNEDESNQEELEELMTEEEEKYQHSERVNINTLTADVAFEFLKITDYQYYNTLLFGSFPRVRQRRSVLLDLCHVSRLVSLRPPRHGGLDNAII